LQPLKLGIASKSEGKSAESMTTQHNTRYTSYGRTGGRLGPFVLGFLSAMVVISALAWASLRFGHPPVAVADPPFPFEAQIVHVPLNARIAHDLQTPPFGTSEDVFEEGAKLYAAACSACHGTQAREVRLGRWMYPRAPQLFRKHPNTAVVGVSDDEPGETYWKIKNGIRLSGMPAFQHIYSDAQMWDLALLLKNADQPLPDPVIKLLEQDPLAPEPAVEAKPIAPKPVK
jgi:thiosulfate dehydrogenase